MNPFEKQKRWDEVRRQAGHLRVRFSALRVGVEDHMANYTGTDPEGAALCHAHRLLNSRREVVR